MSTYINAHQILGEVREGLGEYSESFLTAAETMMKHRNSNLLRHINRSQDFLYALIAKRMPGQFVTSEQVTGVNSVFTLPANFGKLVLFRDEKGRKVHRIGEDDRRTTEQTGSDSQYYQRGNTFVLDKSGVTKTYELIYTWKPRPIHAGVASAGGLASMTLDANYASKVVDQYNGMVVENITQDWVDTVTDYSTARVATIAETAASKDIYGLVSELPEWCHSLIAPKALLIAKASSPIAKSRPTREEKDEFNLDLMTVMRQWLVPDDANVDWAGTFSNFEPSVDAGSVIIAE